jgi:hypothetical protein
MIFFVSFSLLLGSIVETTPEPIILKEVVFPDPGIGKES